MFQNNHLLSAPTINHRRAVEQHHHFDYFHESLPPETEGFLLAQARFIITAKMSRFELSGEATGLTNLGVPEKSTLHNWKGKSEMRIMGQHALIAMVCLTAGCQDQVQRNKESPKGSNSHPAATSEPLDATANEFDATDATEAVKKHILLTEGQERLRQMIGSWWGGPPDGGSVTVRFRSDGGNNEDVPYWAMRMHKNDDYMVFSEFPVHLDHPSVHDEIALSFLKNLGYYPLERGAQWLLGESFSAGSEAVTVVHFREKAPETRDDYRGSTTLPIATHIAYCTLRKTSSGWVLLQVSLRRLVQGGHHTWNEEEIRIIGRGEIERLMQNSSLP